MGKRERDCSITSARQDEAEPDTTWPQQYKLEVTSHKSQVISRKSQVKFYLCKAESIFDQGILDRGHLQYKLTILGKKSPVHLGYLGFKKKTIMLMDMYYV